MNQHHQNIANLIQQFENLTAEQKNAIAKSLKDADKELEIASFKLERTEKVKRTTAILLEETIEELEQKRKAVEGQNRDLEIESSLERVRTVAMGMRKQDDLLDICQTLFTELNTLGFGELRNAMISIYDDDTTSFLNYDYSDSAGKTITHHVYDSHPLIEKQVKEIRSSNEAFSETFIAGKDLDEWRAFRVRKGEPDDPKMNNISALYYYFYSVGTGAIGISTYAAISEEKRNVLKRFRNVFDLAYRRYTDVAQAEAQARESQIQLALERVRARTMAMQRSDELAEVATILFQQVKSLGVAQWACGFNIWEIGDKEFTFYPGSPDGEILSPSKIPLTEDPTFISIDESRRRGDELFVYEKTGERQKAHYRYMLSIKGGLGEMLQGQLDAGLTFPEFQIDHIANFSQGSLLFITYEHFPEMHDIFRRFAKVFEQTYTRFLDLQKAEAQARESQIQLAMERVRARTMAMQQSVELTDAANLLFQQVQSLGMPTWSAGYCIWQEDKNAITAWMSSEGVIQPPFRVPLTEEATFIHMRDGWEKGEELYIDEVGGEVCKAHYEYMRTLPTVGKILDSIIEAGHPLPTFQIMHMAYFSQGFLLFITYEPVPHAHDIFKRFAKVFEQTYTRFLDLQKSEAQSRESQIQLALERVRARTMAMQRSDELAEVATILFQQVKGLGVSQWLCGFSIWEIGDKEFTWYPGSPDGDILPPCKIPLTEHPVFISFDESRRRGDELFVYEKQGEFQADHYRYMLSLPGLGELLQNMLDAGLRFPSFQIDHLANFSHGNLAFITYEHFPEMHDIFKRFAKVFEQTYTRFLDLQKAEEQAREAQIEAALERVRSRTMGMQKSDELSETAVLLFHQLISLGLDIRGCGFNIWEKGEKVCTSWMNGPDGSLNPPFRLPLTEDPFFIRYYESRQNGEDFWVYETGKEELAARYQYLRTLPVLGELLAKDQKEGRETQLPPFVVDHVVNFSNGNLIFVTYKAHPEAWDIFKRFGKVFEQTYTRFLDLQKAEAQIREAKIEAALERARTQSMLMKHSQELDDTLKVFHEQVLLLGIDSAFSYLWLPDELNDRHVFWAAWAENGLTDKLTRTSGTVFNTKAINYPLDRNEPATAQCLVDWKSNDPIFSYHVQPTGVESYFTAWQELFAGVEQLKPEHFSEGLHYVEAFMKYGCFGVMVRNDLPDGEKKTLSRLAIEFERAYTRFLDLQKAEAQSRESQIQLAMERVRARTMAMQRSDELAEAAQLLFKQVEGLGVETWTSGFQLWDEDRKAVTVWTSTQAVLLPPFRVPTNEDPLMIHITDAAQRGETLYVEEMGGEILADHYNYMFSLPSLVELFKKVKVESSAAPPTYQVNHAAYFLHGYLLFITHQPNPEAHDIFKRFAIVFEQTYTRFLDLQTAEAQARESQIQLALERVRARTMAMQKSEELNDVAGLLFKQVTELGIVAWTTGFNVWSDDNNLYTDYITTPKGNLVKAYTIDTKKFSSFSDISDAKKRGDEFFVQYLEGDQLKETYKLLTNFGGEKQYEKMLEDGFQFPSHQYDHFVFGSKVSLMFITYEPVPEAHDIFRRFGKVFEQTYTRFLDLQKAEAQAREAQIEAALERVRSRSMAMQKSDELKEVIQVIYEQFGYLNIHIEHTGFIMDYKERDDMNIWLADRHGVPSQITIPYFDSEHWNSFNEAKEKGGDFFANKLNFEEKNRFYEKLFKYIPGLPEETKEQYFSYAGLAISTVLLENIGLYIENFSGIAYSDEENATLMRFGKVFQQTYTRFLDLKHVEAQALEAVKRASVDRVRAEIASMRTTTDLEKITPLVWNELTTLGVPFVRCGVFIMDEEQQKVHTFLSTPGGKAIATLHVPFDFNLPIIYNGVSNWRGKKVYKEYWDATAFVKSWTALSALNETSMEPHQQEQAPKDLYLHLLPFLQGMLYVGNDATLNEEELQLVQNLADAFSTAYARYDDFNKLESAKLQIEKTLVDLKQAQSQLIQAEKMASLGELTAGIAHEIQNPLNFVNNFSEVNKELLAELHDAIEKEDFEEVKILAKDISGNEEKISHHGKRADAIVKGMLQHSRTSAATKEPTDINKLVDEYLRLAYHGLRAKDKSFNATLKTDFDESIGKINVIPQDIGRAILNLITNAFYVVGEKKKQHPDGYEPTVSLGTKIKGTTVEVSVKDNGNGIPRKVLDKIFQPFFTTKPTGQGTGLGLSLSYDIVKAHGGELKVETEEDQGSEFIIQLPTN